MHPNTITTFARAAGQLWRTSRLKSTRFTNSSAQVAPGFRIHGVDAKAKVLKNRADLTPPSWRKFLTHPAILEIPRPRLRWLQQCDEFEIRKRKEAVVEMDWEHTPRGYCLYSYLPHVPFNEVPRPGPSWTQLQFAFATYQPPVLPGPGPYVQPIWFPQIVHPVPVAIVASRPPAATVQSATKARSPMLLQPPPIAELNAPAPTQQSSLRNSYNFRGGLDASCFNNPVSSSSSSSSACNNTPTQAQASNQLGTSLSGADPPVQTAPANPPASPSGSRPWEEPPAVKTLPFTFTKPAYRQRW